MRSIYTDFDLSMVCIVSEAILSCHISLEDIRRVLRQNWRPFRSKYSGDFGSGHTFCISPLSTRELAYQKQTCLPVLKTLSCNQNSFLNQTGQKRQPFGSDHIFSHVPLFQLITSLFPTIHGNDEVKRGLLLMLFGGVPKTTIEGTTLRLDVFCFRVSFRNNCTVL